MEYLILNCSFLKIICQIENSMSKWVQLNQRNKLSQRVSLKAQFWKLENISIYVNSTQIEHTSTFNFLGIIVEEHLKWDEHVNKIALKISKTIGIINKLKHFLPSYILHTLYNSFILTHMHYGLLIWGYRYERIFELQKKLFAL